MSGGWIDASTVLSAAHEAEFEAACEEAVEPHDATVVPYPFLRVRLRDPAHEPILLVAVEDWGQDYRVAPGSYECPMEREAEVRAIVSNNSLRASVVPSLRFRLELRHAGLLDGLRAALLGRAPTFGPTYPRIAVA
jgi:hypothetical protein